ncbi:MAG TPA: glycosyltransferase family 4 protein [Bacteroidia bacterium]|jgi:glycosyltransferase involved in cell wall biosynthesis|nr:glycosyltransferase family 4 protein [Bacteroidia bacterium]
MKIAVVSAHYLPEIGYQEVHLAKAYARLGHTVKVFTTTSSVNLGGKIGKVNYKTGLSKDPTYGYDILRLSSYSFKSKAYSSGLKKSVNEFKPDLLIILGVAKVFPMSLLSESMHKKTKIVSLYGDAGEYLERNTVSQKIKSFMHETGYTFIKKPLYMKAIKYCDKIILNTPETHQYFLSIIPEKLNPVYESKKLLLNLGFDPDEYFFDEEIRKKKRAELKINDDEVVLITSTRINKRKNLEQVIELISRLNKEGKKVRYILVGFLGDSYEKELKSFIHSQSHPNTFMCFPFLSSQEIQKLYCAADAGIWLKAAISIQEAMGTGLPIILEDKPIVNHLLKDDHNGWFYGKNTFDTTIEKAINVLLNKKSDRKQLSAENASWLSYDAIGKKIISSLQL